MARIISISNHKGGVGKTTTTACLGAGLASKGYKVLMVDLDAQANLTASFYTPDVQEQLTRTIYDAMVEKANLPIFQLNENLHICPSSLNLSQLEFQLVQAYSRESILKKLLAPLVEHFDFILLDCPPALGLMTINAFVASTEVFIPLVAETLPVKGLKVMDDFLSMVRRILIRRLISLVSSSQDGRVETLTRSLRIHLLNITETRYSRLRSELILLSLRQLM